MSNVGKIPAYKKISYSKFLYDFYSILSLLEYVISSIFEFWYLGCCLNDWRPQSKFDCLENVAPTYSHQICMDFKDRLLKRWEIVLPIIPSLRHQIIILISWESQISQSIRSSWVLNQEALLYLYEERISISYEFLIEYGF